MQGLQESEDSVMAEINMTPLVDVMLVLLIIFIVTIPVIHDAVRVQLPQASAAPKDARPEHVNLAIDAAGQVYWNGSPVDEPALKDHMARAGAANPKPELHLSADKRTPYGNVAKVMAAGQRAGLAKISFVTEPEGK